ncbi:MAG: formimidoylglutamate deiminase [Myxococcota bacterium]
MIRLHCPAARLPGGWRQDVLFEVDGGRIAAIRPGAAPGDATRLPGPVLAGMPNAHSHAFQWAMAGLAEHGLSRNGVAEPDSFWTWRDTMYRFALAMDPEALEATAAMLYAEMLEAGYTSVAEFHYLHHQPSGAPHDEPAELALRVGQAAQEAGIGLTLLPVLYAHGGLAGQPPRADQRRFVNTPEGLLRIAERAAAGLPEARVGLALHSLRAVTPEEMNAAIDGMAPEVPIHLHLAEQQAEVDDAVRVLGARPAAWLAAHQELSPRWNLVHATHLDKGEVRALATSGATVVLCPTTEANLGDGLFPGEPYLEAGGRFAIGSDSHVIVDPAEELRTLEGGQRLRAERRNVLRAPACGDGAHHIGAGLWEAAVAGGSRALGESAPGLSVGARADLVVLDDTHPRLAARSDDALLDTFVLAGQRGLVREVWVRGERVVVDGRHRLRDALRARWRSAAERLASAL